MENWSRVIFTRFGTCSLLLSAPSQVPLSSGDDLGVSVGSSDSLGAKVKKRIAFCLQKNPSRIALVVLFK